MHRPVRPSRPAHSGPPARPPACALPFARRPSPVGGATRGPGGGDRYAGRSRPGSRLQRETVQVGPGSERRRIGRARARPPLGHPSRRHVVVGAIRRRVRAAVGLCRRTRPLYWALTLRRGVDKDRRGGRAPRRNRSPAVCCCVEL